MAGAPGKSHSSGRVLRAPYLRLESHACLADVVQRGERRKSRDCHLIQFFQAAATRQAPSDCRLSEQFLKAGPNIGQMVLQQVDASAILTIRFAPVAANISRGGFC